MGAVDPEVLKERKSHFMLNRKQIEAVQKNLKTAIDEKDAYTIERILKKIDNDANNPDFES